MDERHGLGPAVRHKGMEADLWRIAVDAVERTLVETGVELPGAKRRALYEAVVDHLRQGGEADTESVGVLVRLAA